MKQLLEWDSPHCEVEQWDKANPVQSIHLFLHEQKCSDHGDASALLQRCLGEAKHCVNICAFSRLRVVSERFAETGVEASGCVSVRQRFANSGIVIQSAVPHDDSGGSDAFAGPPTPRRRWIHKLTHFEGLLRVLAGADDDEARPRHAAETFQMEPLQHRHGRHGVVLEKTKSAVASKPGRHTMRSIKGEYGGRGGEGGGERGSGN